jgi:Icc-related predicted phosphoesterase
MVKAICISDLHGYLPTNLPKADLLLVAGDICPVWNHNVDYQAYWLDTSFRYWLDSQKTNIRVGCFGNHDFIGESPNIIPKGLPWIYLQNSNTNVLGLNIYGSPDQLPFGNWAFNVPEEILQEKYKLISNETDIIVSHGPPFGYGDMTPRGERVGSKSLAKRILELPQLKLVVTGHIHDCYGTYMLGKTKIVNASLLNEQYEMVNSYIELDL